MSSEEEDFSLEGGLFEEPEGFLPERPKPHFAHYERLTPISTTAHSEITKINLRLVGKSPLWGHLLWNAGKYTGHHIEKHPEDIKDKKVVEFGAASALPSLLCSLNGASKVVSTDYPDNELLENIQYNLDHLGYEKARDIVKVEGFIWGHQTDDIKKELGGDGYADFLIMSDLVFNHSEHHALLQSCKELIKPLQDKSTKRTGGKCLVVFSPHRPEKKMVDNDFKFFSDAEDLFGFDVESVEMVHWDHPMFPEDPLETEEIRKRVYCYILHPTW